MAFTDAEAAQRLLDRHARMVAKCLDDENLHSAEDVIQMSARKFLKLIIETDRDVDWSLREKGAR